MTAVQYRSMMSSSDAIIWNIERDPRLRSTVMAVWQLDSVPSATRMAANVDRMVAAIPRLRQRVVEGRPRPTWVEVDDLDVDAHVHVEQLPDGADFEDALRFAERWVRRPFDRRRPLWQLGLLTGLPGGRAAVVIKVHHAIADGLGMVLMLGAFTDLEADPPPQPRADNVVPFPSHRPTWSPAQRLAHRLGDGVRALARRPVGAIAGTVRATASVMRLVQPRWTPCSTLMTERSGALRLDERVLPIDTVKAAAHRHGATVNDVFVTIATDAVRRYHWRQGIRCERLRVHMPVNSRTARTADVAGNEFVPARIVLDLTANSATRTESIREQLARLRAEPALHHISTVSAMIHRLGGTTSKWVLGGMMRGVDLLASNVPGPPFPLYLAGARIERFVAFGPPAGAAANITLFSYDRSIHLGVTTDVAAIADRALFLDCLDASIAEVVGTAASVGDRDVRGRTELVG